MSTDLLPHAETARERVVLFLAFLTSEACRHACRPYLPPERLTFDLCRIWFDDVYTPSRRYMDSLKGDYSAAAVEDFWFAFSEDERPYLERFHGFLDLRMDMLPDDWKARGTFPENDMWHNIVRDAAHLLDVLEPDPDRLRATLEALVTETLGEGPEALVANARRRLIGGS